MAIELFQDYPPTIPPQDGGLMPAPAVPQQSTFQQLAPAALGLLGTVLGGGNTFARGYAGGMQRATRNRRLQYDQQLRQWQAEQRARQAAAARDIAEQRLGLERERLEFQMQPQAASPSAFAQKLIDAGYQYGTPEFVAAARQQLAKPTGTSITIGGPGGGIQSRPLTPEEAAVRGIPAEQAPLYEVSPKGEVKARPTAKTTQTVSDIELFNKRAVDTIKAAREAVKTLEQNWTQENYSAAQQALSSMYSAVAQARNPKGEPGDFLVKQVQEAFPGLATGVGAGAIGLQNPAYGALDALQAEFGAVEGGGAAVPEPAAPVQPAAPQDEMTPQQRAVETLRDLGVVE